MKPNICLKIFFLMAALLFPVCELSAEELPEHIVVQLEAGQSESFVSLLEQRTETILSAINDNYRNGDFEWPDHLKDGPGVSKLEALLLGKGYYQNMPYINSFISQTSGSEYSIGNLALRRSIGDRVEIRELVLSFDKEGVWIGAEMVPEKESIAPFVIHQELAAKSVTDQVQHHINGFMQAFSGKDMARIEAMLKPDARIVAAVRQPGGGSLYRRNSKGGYIKSLRRIFEMNPDVNLRFDEMEVFVHPYRSHWYGVHLRQYWDSTYYSDTGNLFIIVDMSDAGKPEIQVRSWKSTAYDLAHYPVLQKNEAIVADAAEISIRRAYKAETVKMKQVECNMADLLADGIIERKPVKFVAEKKRTSRYPFYIAAGAAIVAGSALLLRSSGGESLSPIPLPPGRP